MSAISNLGGNFWGSLFENADEGADALGRNQASTITALGNNQSGTITSFGNMIMGWIQAGKGSYPTTTIEKEDNSMIIAIAVVSVAFIIGLAFILKN